MGVGLGLGSGAGAGLGIEVGVMGVGGVCVEDADLFRRGKAEIQPVEKRTVDHLREGLG